MKARHVKTSQYQRGAETVEFMLTLLLFLFVFFMIVDFAVVAYDRGTINNAARWGSRQASLYWVDPYDLQLLEADVIDVVPPRMKRVFVESVAGWTEQSLLIDPSSLGLSLSVQILEGDGSTTDVTSAVIDMTDAATVTVNIDYAHQYLGLSGFVGSIGLGLNSRSSAGLE